MEGLAAWAQEVTNVAEIHGDQQSCHSRPRDMMSQEKFTEAIERILTAGEHREANLEDNMNEANGETSHGPLGATDISKLSMLCTIQSSQKERISDGLGFADVDPDVTCQLVTLLEKHVTLASRIDIIREAYTAIQDGRTCQSRFTIDQWLQGPGFDLSVKLRLGLEATGILLFIMTSPGIDRRVVNEEAIEASIVLLRHNFTNNILPSINNIGHIVAKSNKPAAISTPGSSKKRRRTLVSSDEGPIIREMKKVYRPILATVGMTIVMMERFEALINHIPLDGQQIFTLSSAALLTLELDASTDAWVKTIHQLHVACIGVVTAIFRKYPRERSIIIEDLFPIMLKMPTSKRSLRTFPVRRSSVLCPLRLQSLSYSLVPSIGQDCGCIQAMSALVMSLVQSSVEMPNYDFSKVNEGNNCTEGSAPVSSVSSGLRRARAISEVFASHVLQRCSRKGEDGGASEFRPVLSNLIDDLLFVLLLPEYPSSEMLLLAIVNIVSRELLKASKASKAMQSETTFLNTAFDALGRICAAEAKVLASLREKPIKLLAVTKTPEDKYVDCYCRQSNINGTLMLACDRCHTWYHGDCVGIAPETVPDEWLCDACQLGRIVEFERDKNSNLGEFGCPSGSIDELFCMKRLLIDFLSIMARRDGIAALHDAYRFHLARWLVEISPPGKKNAPSMTPLVARLIDLWDPSQSLEASTSNNSQSLSGMLHCISDEGRFRIVVHVASKQSLLLQSFRSQVELIVRLMACDSAASIRKSSVKAIEKVTDADPTLMLYSNIKQAVTRRFSDDAISVREAAVSLVGSYVVHSPPVANAFHSAFLTGLNDAGVSVRKRTIRILQDILCTNPAYKGRAVACRDMLRLAANPKEDDGVRDLIYDLFMKLWLEHGDVCVERHVESASASSVVGSPSFVKEGNGRSITGMVTPTPEQKDPAVASSAKITRSASRKVESSKMQARSEMASEQMVEVVRAANTETDLTMLFRELLSGVSDTDKDRKASERRKRQKIAQNNCAMIADALFEILISVEERRADLGAALGKELVATIRTIKVFAEVSPSVVFRHLDTLLPYLKADNGISLDEEAALVGATCDILSRLTMIFGPEEVERLGMGPLGNDLVKITYKFGRVALSPAVRSLCTLAHHKNSNAESPFRKGLLTLANTFYKYLAKNQDEDNFTNMKVQKRTNVHRALSVLGTICRHHETEFELVELIDDEVKDNEVMKMTWTNLPALCKHIFTAFLRKSDVPTKCSALRALSGIFVAHPRELFEMNQSGLLEEVMSPDAPLNLQLEALRCWRDLLLSEEARIESGEAKQKMESNKSITLSKKISGDQDGDATLFGGVLASHVHRLFEMTQSKEPQLRFASLDLLGHLLRQGQLNPNEAVPFLFALQGDVGHEEIRSQALKLLRIEGEKRPDMLRQRVCDGVKQAYRFQSTVYPDSRKVSAIVKVRDNGYDHFDCVFSDVFKECIISIKKQRHGLFRNLLGLFNIEDRRNGTDGSKTKCRRSNGFNLDLVPIQLPLLSFASQVLAHLPYNTTSDPLYIIYHISSMIALRGADLLDRLSAFLRPYGLSSSDEYDENNIGEDDLEEAAKKNDPVNADVAKPLRRKNFDKNTFAELCREAAALTLLLRLKKHLRQVYHLNEARCIAYDPDAKERVVEKTSWRPGATEFDPSLHLDSLLDADTIDMNALIRQYSEFRIAMRLEAHTEVISSDSEIEAPIPPATRKRKRSDSGEGSDLE